MEGCSEMGGFKSAHPHSCQASHCLVSYLHVQWILFININQLHTANTVSMWVILLVGTGKCKKIFEKEIEFL